MKRRRRGYRWILVGALVGAFGAARCAAAEPDDAPAPATLQTPGDAAPGLGGLAFVRRHEQTWQIFLRAHPGAPARLLTRDDDDKRDPAWSPDGRRLAYATHRGEVFVLEVESGEARLVAGREHGFFAQPVFLPSGRELVLVRYVTAPSDDSDLWAVDLGPERPTPPRLYYAGEGMEHFPAVAAAENALYFSLFMPKMEKPPIVQEILRMDLATQRTTPVTGLGADSRRAAGHPRGATVAFASDKTGNFELWLRSPEGDLSLLAEHPASDDHPCWSPDGRELVFESTRDGARQLWRLNLEDRSVRKVTEDDEEEREPAWWTGDPAAAGRRTTP